MKAILADAQLMKGFERRRSPGTLPEQGLRASAAWASSPEVSQTTGPQRTPFLGGNEPAFHAWQRYHVRCDPMTLLFIAFEMEMMFMYP